MKEPKHLQFKSLISENSVRKRKSGGICSGQKLSLIKMLTHVHTTEILPLRRPQLPVCPNASATPYPPAITPGRA